MKNTCPKWFLDDLDTFDRSVFHSQEALKTPGYKNDIMVFYLHICALKASVCFGNYCRVKSRNLNNSTAKVTIFRKQVSKVWHFTKQLVGWLDWNFKYPCVFEWNTLENNKSLPNKSGRCPLIFHHVNLITWSILLWNPPKANRQFWCRVWS